MSLKAYENTFLPVRSLEVIVNPAVSAAPAENPGQEPTGTQAAPASEGVAIAADTPDKAKDISAGTEPAVPINYVPGGVLAIGLISIAAYGLFRYKKQL
jgi:hypothetical protein